MHAAQTKWSIAPSLSLAVESMSRRPRSRFEYRSQRAIFASFAAVFVMAIVGPVLARYAGGPST
jgi:hypothetical protein